MLVIQKRISVSFSVFCWHLNAASYLLSFIRNPPDLQEVWLFPASVLRNTSKLKRGRFVLHFQTFGDTVNCNLSSQLGQKRAPNSFRLLCATNWVTDIVSLARKGL